MFLLRKARYKQIIFGEDKSKWRGLLTGMATFVRLHLLHAARCCRWGYSTNVSSKWSEKQAIFNIRTYVLCAYPKNSTYMVRCRIAVTKSIEFVNNHWKIYCTDWPRSIKDWSMARGMEVLLMATSDCLPSQPTRNWRTTDSCFTLIGAHQCGILMVDAGWLAASVSTSSEILCGFNRR